MIRAHDIIISQELSISEKQVRTAILLLDEGGTIPFISRYRKELTGSLDEVQITSIRDRLQQLRDLDKRKESILKSISEQGKLDSLLNERIVAAESMAILEDIYLPFKPKRKTRASMARDKGLQGLADILLSQNLGDLQAITLPFIRAQNDAFSHLEALAGARDIIAETIAEDSTIRSIARKIIFDRGTFVSKVVPGKEDEAIKYKDYFEWSEPLKNAPSHRVLAMRRGEKEELLYLDIVLEENAVIPEIEKQYLLTKNAASEQIKLAILDSYKRLLKPSMETEIRVLTRQKADQESIKVFAANLRQLLLAAPMGQKRLLAIDPGFRTGCKTVVLDAEGNLLENLVIYPHTEGAGSSEAEKVLRKLISKYTVEAIAIGNGTAGRETEDFIRRLNLKEILVVMVNESGASIYSASEIAREEFPNYDLTVRGAVSIGRRLMDPLAELVKIDPKSIGVGQYQHDVDQSKLKSALDDTVISCVNAVGVELNTASKQILSYISGLGPALAQQIVKYRLDHGPFSSRRELKKVPRLGEKAYEQAAGFLRIRNAVHPLDRSAVHPERYSVVEKMAKDLGVNISELMNDNDLRKRIDLKRYITAEIGLPTLNDIISEISKPGLDPRDRFEVFSFTEGVNKMSDLKVGMKLPGIVTNITNFGAFVDIGVHQDGLVHLSQLANHFVSDPNEVVKVQQQIMVKVTEIDEKRKRIALSMKLEEGQHGKSREKRVKQQPEEDLASKLSALASKFK